MRTPKQGTQRTITIAVFCVTLLIPLQTAYANVFNIADGDVPGLIAAVNAANASSGPDTINLAPGGTYTLTAVAEDDGYAGGAGLPYIQSPLTINGNGATIQRSSAAGTPDFRIVYVLVSDLTLNGVTITGGRGGNVNRGGGGIGMIGSNLTLADSTVTDNVGFGAGGGGIGSFASTFRIENSTISHNTSFSAYGGGGIINFAAGATSTITSSTIFENRNDLGRGDAIADAFSGPGTMVVKNSVLASPTRGVSDDCYAAPGVVISQGHNIAGDGTCSLTGPGDMNSTNPLLGTLANNGGNTPTHALLNGSPAIDVIPLADCTNIAGLPVVTDQRGVGRPRSAGCDIGSFEFTGLGANAVPDFSINSNPNGVWSYGYKTLTGSTFTAFTYQYHNSYIDGTPMPVDIWTRPTATQPLLMRNNSSGDVIFPFAVLPTDLLNLHPGPSGERSVLRWTAPASGTFQFQGRFQGLDNSGQTTTDVAITLNDVTVLFNENVIGYGVQRPFLLTRQVVAGDTVDFSVGVGFNGNYSSDSTGLAVVVTPSSDSTPPAITPTVTGTLGNDGWYTSDVEVSWSVTDPESGVSTSTGCDTTSVTVDTTGITFTCSATSGGGSANQSVLVKRDATAPSVSCGSADGAWHASDVSIACTGSDNFSQLANAGDASFSLTTSVAAGTETANASTGSRDVFDNAGNFATAGPISGNKVDKKAPTIAVTTPTNTVYILNQSVAASFTCQDGGSGVASCNGSATNGSNIDTISVGAKTFTVSSADNSGNAAVPQSVSYTVGFGISVLYDQTKAVKSGSTIPIKIQLVDALGNNVSSAAVVVRAVSLVQIATSASETINDAGSANPDANFRFDSSLGGYIFNLKTTGLSTGTYRLGIMVDADPSLKVVQFGVRQ